MLEIPLHPVSPQVKKRFSKMEKFHPNDEFFEILKILFSPLPKPNGEFKTSSILPEMETFNL